MCGEKLSCLFSLNEGAGSGFQPLIAVSGDTDESGPGSLPFRDGKPAVNPHAAIAAHADTVGVHFGGDGEEFKFHKYFTVGCWKTTLLPFPLVHGNWLQSVSEQYFGARIYIQQFTKFIG